VIAFFRELLNVGIYKRSQGRITRQITFAAVLLALVLGLWRLSQMLSGWGLGVSLGVPAVLCLVGVWIDYRLVNFPGFTDFLIAVEAEMNKVSWPTRHELFRASIVVLVAIFSLAVVLTVFDIVWSSLFQRLGVV